MTTAPERPLLHAYEGENPFDIMDSAWGSLERWRVVALQTGEASGLTAIADHVRNDAVAAMDALEERERTVIEREQACDARERAHAVSVTNFVDFVGKASVMFDRLHKLRDDAMEEPLASPPGVEALASASTLPTTPRDPSNGPEPSLVPEDTVQPAHGDPPGDPAAEFTDQEVEFPTGELPTPPVTAQPVSPGLDAEEFEEEKHGD